MERVQTWRYSRQVLKNQVLHRLLSAQSSFQELILRPIVVAMGSPTYRLAKELVRIRSPLGVHSNSIVKNSAEFTQEVGGQRLDIG